jgi:ribosomal protein L34E
MPVPKNRSSSVRKIFRKTQKGKVSIRYRRKKKEGTHHCAVCGAILQGVTTARGLARSERVPSRKFAGVLCHNCVSHAIVLASRLKSGSLPAGEVEVRYKRYVDAVKL